MATRRRFLWPALAGVCLVMLVGVLAGAEPAAAVDPVGSAFRLGTGVSAPNDPGNNVTALTSSAGTTLDVENNAGASDPAGAFAIYAVASATGGLSTGVYGKTNSNGTGSSGVFGLLNQGTPGTGSAGVYGQSTSTTAQGPGVYGLHSSPIGTAPAVVGETYSSSVDAVGVKGIVNTPEPASGAAALRGAIITGPTNIYATGIWGSHNGHGWGVYGQSNNGAGVVGASTSLWAGLFYGNVLVNGTVYKSAGGFKIDHPVDQFNAVTSGNAGDRPVTPNGQWVTGHDALRIIMRPIARLVALEPFLRHRREAVANSCGSRSLFRSGRVNTRAHGLSHGCRGASRLSQ